MSLKLFDLVEQEQYTAMLNCHFVIASPHPTLPLMILNYTHDTQRERVWNDVTNLCRGLVIAENGDIIARPFSKFHNINTEWMPETMLENLPKTLPSITKKMDGSLGVFWQYKEAPLNGMHYGISTRGSFTSEQAIWATNLGRTRSFYKWQWPEGYTPVFEIIYNENRIVVEYPFEDIVLLALIKNETGEELGRPLLEYYARKNSVKLVEEPVTAGLHETEELVAATQRHQPTNEEGYVLSWYKIGKPPLKVKVKFEDYVKLHRIVTGMNPKTVWEMLSNDQEAEVRKLLEDNTYPDQFRLWLRNWYQQLMGDFNDLRDKADEQHNHMIYAGLGSRPTRKDYALYINDCEPNLQPLLFGLLDEKNIDPMIWKQLKPRGNSKAFRSEE